jgi:probable HAF family extracellular repeat protein
MIRRQFAIAAIVINLLLVIAAAAAAQTPLAYRVEDIGTLGGSDTVGLAINSHGEIAGYARLADGSYHAVRWTEAGGLEDLGTNGGWTSQAIAINCTDFSGNAANAFSIVVAPTRY